MTDFKKEITQIIKKETGLAEIPLEVPPNPEMGDYAFPCFVLAKEWKKSPNDIAQELARKIPLNTFIREIKIIGPYLNFFVSKKKLAQSALKEVQEQKDNYGKQKLNKKKAMVEYPAPNTNKPLHLGHVRNLCIGKSVSNILRAGGYKVIEANLNNDRGIHICKSMLAYKLFGKNKKPDKKTDHFVGDYYVLYNHKVKEKPELEEQAKELLRKWESGDKDTAALLKKMNKWALKGFDETYKQLGVKHDVVYNETEHYKEGKNIVEGALKKKLLEKDEDGNIIANLENFKLPNKVMLRADGTSIYSTQDVNLAFLKNKDYKPDISIYVVGNEQELYFRQLFRILEILKLPNYKGLYHLSHGMVYLPDGRMKSREGKVVDADDIIEEVINIARKEVKQRYKKISKAETEKRAKQIGLGALKFFILKYDASKDFVFNPEESLSFEGETGPYVQYTHARICSILRKHGKKINPKIDYELLKDSRELELFKLLEKYPDAVKDAVKQYKPHLIARFLLDISRELNTYYHDTPVLKAEPKLMDARLALITAVKQVLKNGLELLGIEAPERM